MRYLPALTQTQNPVVPLGYGLPNKSPLGPTPVLIRPPNANGVSRRAPERQICAELSNGPEEQSLNGFRKYPLEALLVSIHPHGLNASGYLREKQIAAYREAERIQHADTERAFRFVDLYV